MANKHDRITPEQLAKAIAFERDALRVASLARADIDLASIDAYEYKVLRRLIEVAVRLDVLAAGIRKTPKAARAAVLGMLRKEIQWGGANRPWRLLSKRQLHVATLYLSEFMADATDKIAKSRASAPHLGSSKSGSN